MPKPQPPIPAPPTFAEILYSWAMLPVYAWQGSQVRGRTHRMPPPLSNGRLDLSGTGKPVRLLVIGDSSAAGVGVETIEQSFAGYLPRFLNEFSGRPVQTRIVGLNSATSANIRDYAVPHIEADAFDYVALNIGTNDAKNFHRGNQFCRNFGTLLYVLKTRFPSAEIVWSGVLDLETVPALPSPLNRILGIRSRIIDRNGRLLCRERGVLAPEPEWRPVPENFSADGFHASEAGYREWAENLARYILSLEAEKRPKDERKRSSNVA